MKFWKIAQYISLSIDIKFSRNSINSIITKTFNWPKTEDVDTIDKNYIVLKLSEPKFDRCTDGAQVERSVFAIEFNEALYIEIFNVLYV